MAGAVLSESTALGVKSQPGPESAVKNCTSCAWRSHRLLQLLLTPSASAVIWRLIPGQLPCSCFHEFGNTLL